jgi:hypothetical protein
MTKLLITKLVKITTDAMFLLPTAYCLLPTETYAKFRTHC